MYSGRAGSPSGADRAMSPIKSRAAKYLVRLCGCRALRFQKPGNQVAGLIGNNLRQRFVDREAERRQPDAFARDFVSQ